MVLEVELCLPLQDFISLSPLQAQAGVVPDMTIFDRFLSDRRKSKQGQGWVVRAVSHVSVRI